MSLGEFIVRFPQITARALSSTDSDDCRFISVRFAGVLSSEIGLFGRDLLRTRSSCTFSYDVADHTIEFVLIEDPAHGVRTPLARVDIPLDWFPPNCVVRESFRMKPLLDGFPAPLLFIEGHRIEDGARPWSAPLGQILPRSEAPLAFGESFCAADFARPILAIDAHPSFEISDAVKEVSFFPPERSPAPYRLVFGDTYDT